ncbi:MAG: hypothetical protein J7J87_00920 [Candidatus Diapherotrites archaeon]|nr:hypothetical protein [Candidatus Diapherotrites archaeon]
MLEDFIEVNELKAKIINKPIVNSNSARCELIIRKPTTLKPLLLVHLCKDSINLKKIAKMFTDELRIPEARETFFVTGYKKEYLPPISIYGVIIIMDKKAARKEKLYFLVDEERTLMITPQEIIKANEECLIEDITR